MIERKIQTQGYWQEYAVTDQDLEELTLLFMDVERPMTAVELGQLLVANRCQRDETLVRRTWTLHWARSWSSEGGITRNTASLV